MTRRRHTTAWPLNFKVLQSTSSDQIRSAKKRKNNDSLKAHGQTTPFAIFNEMDEVGWTLIDKISHSICVKAGCHRTLTLSGTPSKFNRHRSVAVDARLKYAC
jgi:hypothetical protein